MSPAARNWNSPEFQLAVKLREELRGQRCRCRQHKVAGQTFCARCYYMLPKEMQLALYKKLFAGYEEAYQAACEFLDAALKKSSVQKKEV
jgi:hypothetical protein